MDCRARYARVTTRSITSCDCVRNRPSLARRALSLSLLTGLLTGLLAASAGRAQACPPVDPIAARSGDNPVLAERQSQVNIALLLDTSNSMDGLIGQAKAQLWSVVNRFRTCKREGRAPQLRIALYEYGNNQLPESEGHIRMVSEFTTDLDLLSEKLFGLQTDGGNEYCGQAIDRATRELSWGTCLGDLNLIFIAGNEPFIQGKEPGFYAQAIAGSVRAKIRVNTIHCGTYQEGVDGKWRDGATLGRGAYSIIDQSQDVRHISTPFDDEISRLGTEVNDTYLAFGTRGKESLARQSLADDATMSLPASAAKAASIERAVTKNSSNYRNDGWDLVDGLTAGNVKLESIKKDDLPEVLREMEYSKQVEFIETKRVRRIEINSRVAELQTKREEFLRTQSSKVAGDASLAAALFAAIDAQAREAGWEFEAK